MSPRKDKPSDPTAHGARLTTPLFPEFDTGTSQKIRTYKRIDHPIWTENKAQFIRHYLRYFVQITKHGAYIDGFAGPQSFEHTEAWCAALVLASEPKWLRRFFLFELSPQGYKALDDLMTAESEARDRKGKKGEPQNRSLSRRLQRKRRQNLVRREDSAEGGDLLLAGSADI